MNEANHTIAPEVLRPRVEGDFANDRVKQAIMARLFDEPVAAARIGRFTVIRELGRGGTGVVYAAYDEQLERKIAVKLLHAEASEAAEADAGARLLREAQAMARLSHPNIVSVHEVGTHHGQIYIAMEFVHGMTLGAWLKKQPRNWREIVEVFRQAGSGLAAAHEAGLVHRDFKPQNAMVGDDGRVRVLDFGLARADGDPHVFADLERTRDSQSHLRALDASLTITGSLIGTPAYMAPEQFRGERADARSDQFALCVALYEALFRERPFAGDTIGELMHSVLAGEVRDPSSPGKVPRALRLAILRGLQTRPAARHPSMEALLAAIDRVVEPRRTPWAAAAALAALLSAGAGMAWRSNAQGHVCEDRASAEIADVWSPERALQIGASLRAVDPLADESWPRAAARFHNYAVAWARSADDACRATEVRREQSQALHDLRRACLDDRKRAFASALELFEDPEPILAVRAANIAAGLEPIETCDDPLELQRRPAPPDDPELARAVADARAELARVEAYRRTGKLDDSLARANALVLPAGYAPLQAELELTRGRILATLGRHKDALLSFRASYFASLSVADERRASAAAIELVRLSGEGLADFVAAERWIRHAQALLARGGDIGQRADLASAQGQLDLGTGRHASAAGHFRRALDLYAQAGLSDSPEAAVVRRTLADAAISLGDLDQAQAQLDQALPVLLHEYCERHPDVAAVRNAAGKIAFRRGDLAGALANFERARSNVAGLVTEDSQVYLQLTSNAAGAHMLRGEYDLAEEMIRRALATAERASVGLPLDVRPLHPELYSLRVLLVSLLKQRNRHTEAETVARTLLADAERAWGPEEPYLSQVLGALADTLVSAGRSTDAIPLAERSYTLATTRGDRVHPRLRYDSAFTLARTVLAAGDPERADSLAREAKSLATAAGDSRTATAVESWLAGRRNG